MEKAVMWMRNGERTSLYTSAKLKHTPFIARKHVIFRVISVTAKSK